MRYLFLPVLLLGLFACQRSGSKSENGASSDSAVYSGGYHEAYRPQFHFTPQQNWMNDPNGMTYYAGVYHLFFQHNPDTPYTGPMHWGHATSTDLLHWEQQPTKIFPDSLGVIFSGSAVVDSFNTSGFAEGDQPVLVAIYTQHSMEKEKAGLVEDEVQSVAYSRDNGKTWVPYSGNPVLKNPGIADFRDPKVFWYAPQKKWFMSLAALDRIHFYSSPDLKTWKKESEFGATEGSHGGVWECPDLIPMLDEAGRQSWLLIVNINPGGPNGGSATQYFLGSFDGTSFKASDTLTRWLDYGPDNYAGIGWNNVSGDPLFIGWMGNWQYAQKSPTSPWRGAMTLPRRLFLREAGGQTYVASRPDASLQQLLENEKTAASLTVTDTLDLSGQLNVSGNLHRLQFSFEASRPLQVVLSNDAGDYVTVGYDPVRKEFYVDRTRSGRTEFEPGFAKVHRAPRLARGNAVSMDLWVDVSSVELFADDGLSCLKALAFPEEGYRKIKLTSTEKVNVSDVKYHSVKRIWK